MVGMVSIKDVVHVMLKEHRCGPLEAAPLFNTRLGVGALRGARAPCRARAAAPAAGPLSTCAWAAWPPAPLGLLPPALTRLLPLCRACSNP